MTVGSITVPTGVYALNASLLIGAGGAVGQSADGFCQILVPAANPIFEPFVAAEAAWTASPGQPAFTISLVGVGGPGIGFLGHTVLLQCEQTTQPDVVQSGASLSGFTAIGTTP